MELLENATDHPVFGPYLFVSGLAWEPEFCGGHGTNSSIEGVGVR